ncbi:MAG: NUDIX domain-containing protein [Rhodanobacteraceae bacterium]
MQRSAGILLYRYDDSALLVLLAHPGGPFWKNRDDGAWSIPKGLIEPEETAEAAARREFHEEIGIEALGALAPLGTIRQRGGKYVEAFALEGEFDPAMLRSNPFELEWPPRSGRIHVYPEVDRAAWMDLALARTKMLESQQPLLDRLEAHLAGRSPTTAK